MISFCQSVLVKVGWHQRQSGRDPPSIVIPPSMKYSALSIVAPGGDQIRRGEKTLEVRKWQPDGIPMKDLLIVQNSVRLSKSGITEDPDGRAVAVVDIEAVSEWREEELAAACGSRWEPGWFAWRITNVRPFDCHEAVPARLRIYEVEIQT